MARQPMRVVWDDQPLVDHAGQAVAPLTPAGRPYRWRLRLPGRTVYTVDADQALSLVIDDYPTPPEATGPDDTVLDDAGAGDAVGEAD